MQRYLVTGGAGFIGSHITERLLKQGHFVRVMDNFSSGKRGNLNFTPGLAYPQNFELVEGDIRDFPTCQKACQAIDFVLHQAALRSVPKSLADPYAYNAVNIDGTLNMLKASHQAGVKRFVFASSSSIYGETQKFPEKETDLPKLISPYALSKLSGEYYCRIYAEIYGLQTLSLRYFNVFGPRQALDDEYAVVVPKFISCMLRDEPPPIFGTGKQSRDFTYIDNVVEGNLLAAAAAEIKCAVFNVAGGRNQTVLDIVAALNKIMQKRISPAFLKERPGDVFKTLASILQAQKFLGYRPKVDFYEGLKRTVEYFKNVKS